MKSALLFLALALSTPAFSDEIKLYTAPHVNPNPSCDMYTSLSLSETHGIEALLVNRLGGSCEIFVLPNERLYSLTTTTDGCGAKVYKGSRMAQGHLDEIKIIDNRTMTCEVPILALVYVEEKTAQGTNKLYSYDGPSTTPVTPALHLVCEMNDHHAQPFLTFLVDRDAGEEQASISYIRSAYYRSMELHVTRPVPGCEAENMHSTDVSTQEIYLECNADGDAGFLSVSQQGVSNTYAGHMTFPNSGIEGYDDMSIPVTCQLQ